MTGPVVSVCILTYNHCRYLRDCVMSAVAQAQDVPLEILVGDDESTDGTSEIAAALAAQFPGLVRHYRRVPRLGANANFQALVGAARGKYLATLDGDDFWLPGKLRAQVRFLEENPGCGAVYANALVVDAGQRLAGLFSDAPSGTYGLEALLARGNFLHTSSVLYRAAFRESLLQLPVPHVDYRAHLNFALHSEGIGYLADPLAAYRFAEGQSMVSQANESVREWYWQAIAELPRACVSPAGLAEGMADFLRRVWFRAVRMRSPKLALDWTRRVLRAAPVGPVRMLWLTAVNAGRNALLETGAALGRALSRSRLRVLYRR